MGTGAKLAAGMVGLVVVGGIVSGCGAATPSSGSSPAVPADASNVSYDGSTGRTTTSLPPGTAIAAVIDGDTFRLTDGHEVRVLGIDSCEMSTTAGRRAQGDAEDLLTGSSITMTAQPGVDVDRYGRLLRYVDLGARGDFGTAMVRETHTAVYAGHNDASPERVAALQAADGNGRDCSERAPSTTTSTTTIQAPSDGDDHHHYDVPDVPAVPDLPAPTQRHTGHTGHPCLPGERDGDHDGYCGEGKR